MNTKEDVLQNCRVEGTVIKLPNIQLDRKLYQQVAKSIELIGGKWKGGKVFGFVFTTDPTDLLNQIANGEKRNLKKEFQFFATPEKLADYLIELAEIQDGNTILEPSAGQGAIVKAVLKKFPNEFVHAYELMDVNRLFLQKIKDCILLGEDFLNQNQISKGTHTNINVRDIQFDRIIANPPFSQNQDIDHVKEMYYRLKKGGRLVSIMSESWINGNQKKQVDFKNWLNEVEAEIIDIEKGSFKESGTMVAGKIVVINKSPNTMLSISEVVEMVEFSDEEETENQIVDPNQMSLF